MNTAIQSGTTGGQFSSEEASAWKRRHDAWAELSGLLLYEYDSNSGNIFWGGSLREVTGYGPEEMTGGIDQWSVRVHPEDRAEALAALKDVQQSGEVYDLEYRFLHQDGQYRWMQHRGRFLVSSGNPELMIGFMADITPLRQLQEELERQTRTDALTGALNRRHFLAIAEQELARAARYQHPLSLLLLSVDEFDSIRNTHGQGAADYVLQQLTAACAENLRHVDGIGRLEDDEFAILLPESDEVSATDIARRLHGAIEQAVLPLDGGVTLRFTVSLGQVSLKGDSDLLGLLRRAQFALLEAKRTGRNRICIG